MDTTIDTLLKIENLKRGYKMMPKRYLVLIFLLLMTPIVIAEPSYTFKQYETPNLKISCFDTNQSLCSSGTSCYVTVQYPDLTTDLVKNGVLTHQTEYFNYTLPSVDVNGIYTAVSRCEGSENAFSTFTFEVTPTGKPQTSILDNPMLLILGFLAIFLISMGAYFGSPWFGFLGAMMFLLGGIYTMIFGFNNVTDLYTRGIGITFIGLGFVFMFASAYEWIWGNGE